MKENLNDFTFLIPTSLDSIDRLENVLSSTNLLKQHHKINIVLLEITPYNNRVLEKLINKTIKYSFQEDHDFILHRIKYIDHMTQTARSPIFSRFEYQYYYNKRENCWNDCSIT